ncbi:PepSY domain-containing protein [Streptomyces sp. ODS28]|uniref:PepSY domain-containing protein n=1 Tax=Streptomyces sp. ODS28 TaxID=3136688 RepID=UPI0031EDA53B
MRRNWRIIAVAGAASLLLGAALSGCSDGGSKGGTGSSPSASASPSSKGPAPSSSPPSAGPGESSPASVRNGARALATAAKAVSGTAAYAIEHDAEGQRDWVVKTAEKNGGAYDGKQYAVRVSDDGGTVRGKRGRSDKDDDAAKLEGSKVTLQDAVRRASEDHPGEELDSAEIDKTRRGTEIGGPEGTAVWEVRLANPASASPDEDGGSDVQKTEVVIDAVTGKQLTERGAD